VYVGLGGMQMFYSREKFHRLLREYVEAGMTNRIMFGVDGHPYDQAIEAYESAEFLSDRQLEGIFCKNAERFLRKRGVCDAAD
jgi:predicted TIM-barrel fold metal-dependent hydrolase